MRDILPADKARRERVLSVIRERYRAHGFDEIETPWCLVGHSHIPFVCRESDLSFLTPTEGQPVRVISPGEVLHELPDRNMVANNISSTKGARFLVFQVGDIGKPLTVKVE